ncbi:hypothetical protein AMECASPLE_037683 [Ameca splendens]|uniref:Uncharacterized protein n=1 Tax=Ameca splendens TaxID=208324 RepID=A0ABV0ZTU2_9TELE
MRLFFNKQYKHNRYNGGAVGSTVCSKKVLGSTPSRGLSAWSLHVFPVHAWLLTGYSGFLPQSKDMPIRLIGLSILSLGVKPCVHGLCVCVALRWSGNLSRVNPASRP